MAESLTPKSTKSQSWRPKISPTYPYPHSMSTIYSLFPLELVSSMMQEKVKQKFSLRLRYCYEQYIIKSC